MHDKDVVGTVGRNVQNTDRLMNVRNQLASVVELLDNVIAGTSTLAGVARKLDMTPQALNHNLDRAFSLYMTKYVEKLEEKDLKGILLNLETSSDKLVKAILGYDEDDLVDLPEYDEDMLWETVYDTLKKRYYDVICMRYGYGTYAEPMKLEAIGVHFNVTRERVRQIEYKAIRRLRNPLVIKEIFGTNFSAELLKKEAEPVLSPEELRAQNLATSIDNLKLSIRTYNCLKRQNFNTVADVYNANTVSLVGIRNMGTRSVLEIMDKLKSLDLFNPEWTFYYENTKAKMADTR